MVIRSLGTSDVTGLFRFGTLGGEGADLGWVGVLIALAFYVYVSVGQTEGVLIASLLPAFVPFDPCMHADVLFLFLFAFLDSFSPYVAAVDNDEPRFEGRTRVDWPADGAGMRLGAGFEGEMKSEGEFGRGPRPDLEIRGRWSGVGGEIRAGVVIWQLKGGLARHAGSFTNRVRSPPVRFVAGIRSRKIERCSSNGQALPEHSPSSCAPSLPSLPFPHHHHHRRRRRHHGRQRIHAHGRRPQRRQDRVSSSITRYRRRCALGHPRPAHRPRKVRPGVRESHTTPPLRVRRCRASRCITCDAVHAYACRYAEPRFEGGDTGGEDDWGYFEVCG